jgi:glycosyltransferase involved in cell wall biosynthesis
MRRLAIVDQLVSAGGVERFLHGLIGGFLQIPQRDDWEVTLFLAEYNTGGYCVEWPAHLRASNIRVRPISIGRSRVKKAMDGLYKFAHRNEGGLPSAWVRKSIAAVKKNVGVNNFVQQMVDNDTPSHAVEAICNKADYDVVYFSYPFFLECPLLRAPIVSTPHEFNYLRFQTLSPESQAQFERQMPVWLEKSNRLVVSSEFAASEMREFYPGHERKTRVIRLGVPRANVIPTNDDIETFVKKKGLPPSFVLTSGWIALHKNQGILMEAVGKLKQRGRAPFLVFNGPNSHLLHPDRMKEAPTYMREVTAAGQRYGLEYGVDYLGLGYVSDSELEGLYRRAAALVLPTLYEAGSFPLLEAVRALCPVIASEIPSLKEQARLLGDNIVLFDPHDSDALAARLEDLFGDRAAAARRAEAAKRLEDEVYSWGKTATGYFEVFGELAAEYRGRRSL